MPRSLPVALVCLFCTSILLADTEFEESVPLELVKAFLGATSVGEIKLYSDIMEDFPAIELPSSFTALGSIDRVYQLSAAFSTRLNRTDAASALHTALLQAEFIEFAIPSSNFRLRGFVAPGQNLARQVSRYCHNEYGFASYVFHEMPSGNLVTLSTSLGSDNRSCVIQLEEQNAQMRMAQNRRGSGLDEYLPTLHTPENTSRRLRSPFSQGYSGGGGSLETEANLYSDWEIASVYEHFKLQIEEQGWQLDSEDAGAATATGSWTLSPDADSDLVGTLTVIKSGDERYELKFRLVDTNGNGRSGGLFVN